jgi:hypothetical protein
MPLCDGRSWVASTAGDFLPAVCWGAPPLSLTKYPVTGDSADIASTSSPTKAAVRSSWRVPLTTAHKSTSMIRSMSLSSDFATSPLKAMPALLYAWLPTEVSDNVVRVSQHRLPFRDVQPVRLHLCAQRFGLANRIGQTFSVDVRQRQLCTLLGQIPRQRHARPGTGDDGDLPIE